MFTGLDFAIFEFVEHDFKHFFDNYSPYSKDGTIVALVVEKCRSRMVLELIFSMTQAGIQLFVVLYPCPHQCVGENE